ncbi:MAG: hypothetical protein KBA06_04070, partial [Saprospiraceae bacterium]|nr:hypothetical protein [Saprospiraceae bacterium]
YAAGVSDNGDKRKISVYDPNGRIRKTKDFGLFKIYPKVSKGSLVKVGYKEKDIAKEKQAKKEIDWGKLLTDSIAQATAILTLVILLQNVNK